MERAIQTYLGVSYGDRLHVATHHHNAPLVARERIKRERGRIDLFGNEALPLREQDVRDAAVALLDAGVKAIVVSLQTARGALGVRPRARDRTRMTAAPADRLVFSARVEARGGCARSRGASRSVGYRGLAR
jgi:hypothetical protein